MATRSTRRQLAAIVLLFEAVVVVFAALVVFGLRMAEVPVIWAVGGGVAVVCLLIIPLLRFRFGYVLGSVLQVAVVGLGFVLPTMFAVGGIFAALWVAALVVGRRIDSERVQSRSA